MEKGKTERAKFDASVQYESAVMTLADGREIALTETEVLSTAIRVADRPNPIRLTDICERATKQMQPSLIAAGGDAVLSLAAHSGSATYTLNLPLTFFDNLPDVETKLDGGYVVGVRFTLLVTVRRVNDA